MFRAYGPSPPDPLSRTRERGSQGRVRYLDTEEIERCQKAKQAETIASACFVDMILVFVCWTILCT